MRYRVLGLVAALAVGAALLSTAGWAAVLKGQEVPSDLATAATTYANALVGGNTTAAWNLLSEASQKEMDAPAWQRAFERRAPATKPPATALLRTLAAGEPVATVGEVLVRPEEALVAVKGTVPVTKMVAMVKEKGTWRVDLRTSDEVNAKEAARDFLGAVREDTSISQGRAPRQAPEASLPLLRVILAPEAKDYKVQEAEVDGDRAQVTLVAEVPVNVVLRATRSGAGWAVDLARPVVPIDYMAENPLQEAVSYADRADCEEQLRQLVRGIQMYAAGSDDMLPNPDRWLDQIRPYLAPGLAAHCPRDATPGVSYAFNANLKGRRLKEVANPSLVPMLYESRLHTKNPADTGQSWAESRHADGNLVAFVDGTVRPAISALSFQVTTASTTGEARASVSRPPQPAPGRNTTRRSPP